MKKYIELLNKKTESLSVVPSKIRSAEDGIEELLDHRKIRLLKGIDSHADLYISEIDRKRYIIIDTAYDALETIDYMRDLLDLFEEDVKKYVEYPDPDLLIQRSKR